MRKGKRMKRENERKIERIWMKKSTEEMEDMKKTIGRFRGLRKERQCGGLRDA